jgi:hypothetical protein
MNDETREKLKRLHEQSQLARAAMQELDPADPEFKRKQLELLEHIHIELEAILEAQKDV